MGSTFISSKVKGHNLRDAFKELQENDARLYGEEYYSGHFGSASLGREVFVSSNLTGAARKKEIEKILDDEMENGNNHGNIVRVIDANILGYEISSVKKKNIPKSDKTKPKWEQVFRVIEYGDMLYESTDQKKAVEKLLELAVEHPRARVVKEPKLVQGNPTICEVEVTRKVVQNKPKRVAAGATIREIHEYVFFGWVSI